MIYYIIFSYLISTVLTILFACLFKNEFNVLPLREGYGELIVFFLVFGITWPLLLIRFVVLIFNDFKEYIGYDQSVVININDSVLKNQLQAWQNYSSMTT